MAVEARHMNLFPPQFLTNSEIIKPGGNNNTNLLTADLLCNAQQMESVLPLPLHTLPLVSSSSPMAEPILPFYPSKADSGLTYNHHTNIPAPAPTIISRKRHRDLIAESTNIIAPINKLVSDSPNSFLDQDILYQIHNQQSEIDHFISQHTEKVRIELEKQRARQSRTFVTGIQDAMAKKLKEKDEEIQRIGKMNWALQERVKTLCVENQIWRELAQTNEATANSLRNNLEQVLAHVAVAADDHRLAAAPPLPDDDAESSCGSNNNNNNDDDEDRRRTTAAPEDNDTAARMCRRCGERESIVLLLPCRHLCLCTMCGSTVRNCPVCHSGMNASVHVNFS